MIETECTLDVAAIRKHFPSIAKGRIVTNNAASTQPPAKLADLYRALAPDYENVHRGQSSASKTMTHLFEEAYDTIAAFLGAKSASNIALFRNATEAHNAVMYSLMTEFRDGDNIVTTMMEHNSNYVPWYGLAREILPKFGRTIEVRVVDFDPRTGELDMEDLAAQIDDRTKLVAVSGASNFFGTKNPVKRITELAHASDYNQPHGTSGSYVLIDGAQLVPSTYVDVEALDVDFLSFSFHKVLAPFGVGVLYGKYNLLEQMPPFLYGGDMVLSEEVAVDSVEYNYLPWKFSAGTPNILGAIASAQALRILLDLALSPEEDLYFMTGKPIEREAVREAMGRISAYTRSLAERALERMKTIPGITIYGPLDASKRTSLVAFNVEGRSPYDLADALNEFDVESRAGCHCASLAHRALMLEGSCRLSFYLYNTLDEVDTAVDVLAKIVRENIFATSEAPRRGLATS
ncbi:MAG: cysteine desulfurase [Bacteroidota bacterium]|nr:cysteine desulfurase [Bacteroidota bacterium]MDP4234244.1 cysteine desulfurase [Bacteroidota bacterium]MDP4243434.1 cysteine desulfurase [Bacteroidota bacterium]MDP4288133.1 cysteine desulfurase [Bacteroidota bacterium]